MTGVLGSRWQEHGSSPGAGPVYGMAVKPGDVLYVSKEASVQFMKPIYFRVIRVRDDWITYDRWVWLDGYELNAAGDAVNRRSIFVQKEGLRTMRAATRPVRKS